MPSSPLALGNKKGYLKGLFLITSGMASIRRSIDRDDNILIWSIFWLHIGCSTSSSYNNVGVNDLFLAALTIAAGIAFLWDCSITPNLFINNTAGSPFELYTNGNMCDEDQL